MGVTYNRVPIERGKPHSRDEKRSCFLFGGCVHGRNENRGRKKQNLRNALDPKRGGGTNDQPSPPLAGVSLHKKKKKIEEERCGTQRVLPSRRKTKDVAPSVVSIFNQYGTLHLEKPVRVGLTQI